MLAMNGNGTIIAVSAVYSSFEDANGGIVRTYKYNETTDDWYIFGGDTLYGTVANEGFGMAVALNGEGDILAISSVNMNSQSEGCVNVFRLDSTWKTYGSPICGTISDQFLGTSLAMNRAGDVLIMGAQRSSSTGNTGAVYVCQFDSLAADWVLLGQPLVGAENSWFGSRVAVNDEGTIIAVGAPKDDSVGKVYVYSSLPIVTQQPTSQPSSHPSMSPTSSPTLDIIHFTSSTGFMSHGSAVYGSIASERMGGSISLTHDGSIMALGSIGSIGEVYIRVWDGSDWHLRQVITDTSPYAPAWFGHVVKLSGDGSRLVVSAPKAPSVQWLNASSVWNVEIRRRGFNSRTYQIRADEPLILHAVVVSPRNISREHQQSLQNVWTLRNENGSIIPMISASTNPMVLHVPPGILLTGHHYAVDVEVWDLSPRLATVVHKAETTLITRWQPYLVLRWPASTRISMPLGSAAVVNVTLVDGNVHPVADASLHIDVNMSWTCRWEDTSVCPNAVNISSRWASTKWKPLNGSSLNSHQATVLLTIHLDTSIPTLIGQFMVVCVELSYNLPSDDDSSSSPQRIQRTERLVIDVVGHTNPMLFVQPTAATQLRQTTRVLPSFAEVQVLSNSTPSCNWQLVYPRTMALKSSLRRSTSPPSNSSWLTLGPFTSAFTTYRDTSSLLTFRVTCDATATEFDVYQNSPPYGGRLLRAPQVGVALSTLFHLEAPLWRDDAVDDYPLRYVFAISDSLENEWWTIPSHIYEPFVEDILLPQLIVATTSSMRIYQMHRLEASVQDNWGAIAVATTNISLRNSSAFSGTAAAEHASYWTALSSLLHHGIDAKGSAQVLVTNATYPRQQRAVAVLATVSSMVFATSSATASSSKMFSQASTFLKHDWESFWNQTVAVSDLTPSPATSDAAVTTEADLIDAWSLQYEYVALVV
eukprot:gene9797-7012_t